MAKPLAGYFSRRVHRQPRRGSGELNFSSAREVARINVMPQIVRRGLCFGME